MGRPPPGAICNDRRLDRRPRALGVQDRTSIFDVPLDMFLGEDESVEKCIRESRQGHSRAADTPEDQFSPGEGTLNSTFRFEQRRVVGEIGCPAHGVLDVETVVGHV